MLLKVNEVVRYASHSVNQAGAVTLTFKARHDQIGESVTLLRMLNSNQISVKAKLAGGQPFVLGTFMLKGLSFNQHGESTIKLSSVTEAVECGRLQDIVTMELLQVRFSADVDDEEEEES